MNNGKRQIPNARYPPAHEHEIALPWRQRDGVPVYDVEVTTGADQHVAGVNVGVAKDMLLRQPLHCT